MRRRFAWILLGIGVPACEKPAAPIPVEASAPPPSATVTRPPSIEQIEVPEVAVRASGSTVVLTWSTPRGTGVNEDAPFKVRWNRSEGLLEAPAEMKATGAFIKNGFKIPVKPAIGAPRATL